MDIPARFPLNRLPSLAVEEVMSTMLPFELYNFSKVSTSCRLIVKAFSKNRIHKHYSIHIMNTENPTIKFERNKVFYGWEMTNEIEKDGDRYSSTGVECFFQNEAVYVYCDGANLMEKCMEMFIYLKDLFNIGIDYCHIYLWEFKELHQTILDWLLSNFRTLVGVSIDCGKEPVALLEHTLKCLTITKNVHICGQTMEKSPYSIPEHFDEVRIDYGEWITLELLMSFKASTIKTLHAGLSDADLNSFLKSWINMECLQNLRSLEATVADPNLETVLQDVPHRFGNPDRSSWRNRQYQQMGEGVEIDRNDGIVASIFVYQVLDFFVMVMTTSLTTSG